MCGGRVGDKGHDMSDLIPTVIFQFLEEERVSLGEARKWHHHLEEAGQVPTVRVHAFDHCEHHVLIAHGWGDVTEGIRLQLEAIIRGVHFALCQVAKLDLEVDG